MPSFTIPSKAIRKGNENESDVIKREEFDRFNPGVLGLGDLKTESVARSAISVFFDLQGFTVFCKQIEPHLSVPIYLNAFLNWIFGCIKAETAEKQNDLEVELWHDLPFFVKFMGDGLLVLWDTSSMDATAQHNLLNSCLNILIKYRREFLPGMKRKVVDPPPVLRCGIAKGTVFSVGNGEDYVGSCINMAARLQKLSNLTFAFARRGFDPEAAWDEKELAQWTLKKVPIRGIGDSELIYLRTKEFEALSEQEQGLFGEP